MYFHRIYLPCYFRVSTIILYNFFKFLFVWLWIVWKKYFNLFRPSSLNTDKRAIKWKFYVNKVIVSLMIIKFTFLFSYVDAMKIVDLDMTASQQAITFISSWLRTPKLTTNLIIPTYHHFRLEKIVKIAKILTNHSNDRLFFQSSSKFQKTENRNILKKWNPLVPVWQRKWNIKMWNIFV